ncbi:hypothetical protein CBM2631_A60024 [Cupriavidus taiwanensis]|nr:hypothetical protein CBM2631_A60024 [Cupriavidus taiwanensis]
MLPDRPTGLHATRAASWRHRHVRASMAFPLARQCEKQRLQMMKDLRIRAAVPTDAAAVGEVLERCGLPVDGVPRLLEHFHVAILDAQIIGCAAGERCGETVVIRSVAVLPETPRPGRGHPRGACRADARPRQRRAARGAAGFQLPQLLRALRLYAGAGGEAAARGHGIERIPPRRGHAAAMHVVRAELIPGKPLASRRARLSNRSVIIQ